MSAYEHRWIQILPIVVSSSRGTASLQDEIVAVLNADDVGGAGWRFAGMLPDAILVVRERPPPGAISAGQVAEAEARRADSERRK